MGRPKLKRAARRDEVILASDIVLSVDVAKSCNLLIGVLLPLLKDAHDSRDMAVAAFCSRLVTDLGALRSMVGEMLVEDEIASDNALVAEDENLSKFFDGLLMGASM